MILKANIVFQAQYELLKSLRMASALILRKHAALGYHSPHISVTQSTRQQKVRVRKKTRG